MSDFEGEAKRGLMEQLYGPESVNPADLVELDEGTCPLCGNQSCPGGSYLVTAEQLNAEAAYRVHVERKP